MDSAYEDAAHFSKGDLAVLLTYLQFLWVLDPVVWAMCRASHPEWCSETKNYFAGVHRWYLLVVLLIKVALVFFRLIRAPPLAQCIALTVLGCVMPSEVFCLSAAKCAVTPDWQQWKDNYETLGALWTFLLQGAAQESQDMNTSALRRYYVLFMAQYFSTFRYALSFVHRATAIVQQALKAASPVTAHMWWRCTQCVALCTFLFCELMYTGLLGPRVYAFMQEDVTNTFEPQLLPILLIYVSLAVQVTALALVLSPLERRLKWLGSTTLGCYMIHFYFIYPLMVVRTYFASLGQFGFGGLAMQTLLFFAVPLAFQFSVGVAFHRLLMLEHQFIFSAISRIRWKRGS